MSEQIIEDGKVVTIQYVLKDPSGQELDKSAEDAPLAYLHGAHNIVPGLEKELVGKKPGDKVQATVPPEEGYGIKRGKPQQIPKSRFPQDAQIRKGMSFMTESPDGRRMALWVTKVMGPMVTVTTDHPLAGVTLCFSVEVLEVRDATEEERAHGHVHGPGGHHHGDDDGDDADADDAGADDADADDADERGD